MADLSAVPSNAGHGVGRRAILTGATAGVGSAVAAIAVATIAKAIGAQHASQLRPGPLALLTLIGVAFATTAWVLISRSAAHPVTVLRRLVPVVLVVSFVPDLLVGLGAASAGAAVSLAVAHVAVFAVTIPLLISRLHPTTITGVAEGRDFETEQGRTVHPRV